MSTPEGNESSPDFLSFWRTRQFLVFHSGPRTICRRHCRIGNLKSFWAPYVRVFHNKSQQVNQTQKNSPSAGKPRLVLDSWRKLGVKIDRQKVRPLTINELCLAHDRSYVQGVIAGRIKNGFGNTSREISNSLPWTTGSFVSAAIHAMRHRVCTFSPTSGFHHACYRHASGFCTFNGLTIAAIILLTKHSANRVGILDLDSHAGDGTDETLARTRFADFVEHYSLGYHDVNPSNNQQWLDDLPALIRDRFADCDVLFYQAGVDCHIDDPYLDRGGFTTQQIQHREELVFSTCTDLELPVVTNLAGGYQTPIETVLKLHDLTALAYAATAK